MRFQIYPDKCDGALIFIYVLRFKSRVMNFHSQTDVASQMARIAFFTCEKKYNDTCNEKPRIMCFDVSCMKLKYSFKADWRRRFANKPSFGVAKKLIFLQL